MALNLLILLACMSYVGAVLTLPGIAGFILTIGIGVDSNVLIFERIKEELVSARGVRAAVSSGFDRVFLTIVDTHIASLIAADRAGIDLPFKTAAAIDLAGRDVVDAIRTSVDPKVIDCPSAESGKATVDAVAANGIQLRCKARVTVRTNIERLVGGATEETVIARVGEGIVSGIGQAESHKTVLANPRKISQEVLDAGLDAGTAYEIVSIDIADIDVGENIGAVLMANQAEAEKRRAQAEAEAQRARAVARGQEMEALGKENQAKVILAEAEIPRAIAGAFNSGNLGIMDYYNLRNIQADTDMRKSLSNEEDNDNDGATS